MDFQTAVKILAGQIEDNSIYTETVKVPGNVLAANALSPRTQTIEFTAREMAIKTITQETGADGDWIANGDWSGDETVTGVVAEWNG